MATTILGAKWIPSVIKHPKRSQTLGICIHNTYGSKQGDIVTLTRSGRVDCHFYISKDGALYQFLPLSSTSWTAMRTANTTCIHIEHEGKREEPWTPMQFKTSVKLCAWLCQHYGIPVRHVDPPRQWRGLFDHRDLMRFENNNHGDGVPPEYPGWRKYLTAIQNTKSPKLTLRQRLAKAGFGKKSVDAIVSGRAKAPRSSFGRLIRAGFGRNSAKKLTGYDLDKAHDK